MKCNAYHVFFRNLSNATRILIITELKEKPMSVNELAEKINVEQSKLSHALANLKSCNLVESKQSGKKRIYFLNKKTILPILKIIDKHKKNFCSGCELK